MSVIKVTTKYTSESVEFLGLDVECILADNGTLIIKNWGDKERGGTVIFAPHAWINALVIDGLGPFPSPHAVQP